MKHLTFSIPFLPPSLNVYRNDHWQKQREEEKTWKDYITMKWVEMGRPKLQIIRIAMIFSFPARRTSEPDNYLATGSKLVGDAVKGLFIPDGSPERLTAWSFLFEFGDEAKTTIVIVEVDGNAGGHVSGGETAFWEDFSLRSEKTSASAGDDAKRSAGEQVAAECLSGRQASEAETATGCPFQRNSCHRCPSEGFPAGRTLAGSSSEGCPLQGNSFQRRILEVSHADYAAGPSAVGRPVCSLYETCIAPLCPLDRSSLEGIWYPDEEICHSRTQGNHPWLKAQRRLSKVAAAGYFTVEMLNRLVIIRKGISGFDPNVPEEQQLRAWFQKRADKQDAPPETKAARSRHLKKFSFKKRAGGEG